MLNLARARNGGESLSPVGCHSDCAAACQHGAFLGHTGGGCVCLRCTLLCVPLSQRMSLRLRLCQEGRCGVRQQSGGGWWFWARSCFFLHGVKGRRMCLEQTSPTDRSFVVVLCDARVVAYGHNVNLMGDRIVDFLKVLGFSAGIFAGMCGRGAGFHRKSNHVLVARCCWMRKSMRGGSLVLWVQACLLLSFVMSNTTCVPHLISHWS